MSIHTILARSLLLVGILAAPVAHGQFAVIDVGTIAQLVTQAQTLEQQLSTARDHLAQAQAAFNSTTGSRGMERLLGGVQRNYLPGDWTQFQAILQGYGGSYGTLSSGVLNTVSANAILTSAQLAAMTAGSRQQIDASRRQTALLQSVTHQALQTASGRFISLQQLIDALPGASDQKAVLELQARVSAENAMLQNEQTKLQTLFQAVQAEEQASRQQMRERIIAGHGSFTGRFQPAP
jgi:type IV secretion system protein VirB5